jgi:hypothetical protein
MIDANAVLAQLRAGMAPGGWQVLPAKRSHFVTNGVAGFVLAILAIAGAAYVLFTGTVFGYGLTDQTSNSELTVWLVIDLVVLLAFVIGGIVSGIRSLAQLDNLDEQALILMPEGFVMRRGSSEKQTTTVSYATVAGIRMTANRGGVYLLIQPIGRSPFRIALDGRYGKPKQLAQQITGAFARFAAARAAAQRG